MADQARKLRLRLQEETLDRIRADRERASVRVAQLLEVMEDKLFHPDLDVKNLLRWSGQRDKNISTRFAAEIGLPPKAYMLQARMKLAGRMLAASRLAVWRIGVQIGYLTPSSFNRAFKDFMDQSPTAFRQAARSPAAEEPQLSPVELTSRLELEPTVTGHLIPERAEDLINKLDLLGSQISANYQHLGPSPAAARTIESAMARNLWQIIEPLPYDYQLQAITRQAATYRTDVLFHRLCAVSLGAEDSDRALQWAEFAHLCAEPIARRLDQLPPEGKLGRNIDARAWGVTGNAQRRVGDLEAAEHSFDTAARMLEQAGDHAHPVVASELCFYQATFEIMRDDFEEARLLLEMGTSLLLELVDGMLTAAKAAKGPSRADAKNAAARTPRR